ncbi:MAG: hypothetical protein GY949_18130 [Gammaproteobacteria bacterium]|nr:hypothetical protein [Gammaproteobacteria bacterium]
MRAAGADASYRRWRSQRAGLPGFKHDLYGSSHVWIHSNPTFRDELRPELEKHGLKYIWAEDDAFYQGPSFQSLEIEDRVGGGDGFASGFCYAFLTGADPQTALNIGTAHGALLQSTRGDTSQITLDELMHVASGGSARIKR